MNNRHLLTAAAFALPLALAPASAYAQSGFSLPGGVDIAQLEQTQPPADEPAGAAEEPATAPEEQETDQQAGAETEQFIEIQEESQTLASSLIGVLVTNPEGESIGKVSDLLFSERGELSGMVVHVGGFLGLGGKKIGVSLGKMDQRTDENGDPVMVLQATVEELEQVADFKSVADIRREREAAERAAQRGMEGQPGAAPPPGSPDR